MNMKFLWASVLENQEFLLNAFCDWIRFYFATTMLKFVKLYDVTAQN